VPTAWKHTTHSRSVRESTVTASTNVRHKCSARVIQRGQKTSTHRGGGVGALESAATLSRSMMQAHSITIVLARNVLGVDASGLSRSRSTKPRSTMLHGTRSSVPYVAPHRTPAWLNRTLCSCRRRRRSGAGMIDARLSTESSCRISAMA
jgi:hypothetical protein